jgi:hypothetical protein
VDEEKRKKKQTKLVNRIQDYEGKLIIICTVCSDPLGVPIGIESSLLHCDTLICPTCKQYSTITKELKKFIVQY